MKKLNISLLKTLLIKALLLLLIGIVGITLLLYINYTYAIFLLSALFALCTILPSYCAKKKYVKEGYHLGPDPDDCNSCKLIAKNGINKDKIIDDLSVALDLANHLICNLEHLDKEIIKTIINEALSEVQENDYK